MIGSILDFLLVLLFDAILLSFFKVVGSFSLRLLFAVGDVTLFSVRVFKSLLSRRIYLLEFVKQLFNVGLSSVPLISLTALFTGAVLALQSYVGFSRFNAEDAIASIVVVSLTRELGPVLTALMAAGRIGAGVTSEIATMKVSEQVDALRTLSVDPMKFLVAPRFFSIILSVILLTIMSDILGIWGGYLVGVYDIGFDSASYLQKTASSLVWHDVYSGIVKSCVFGFIIAISSCYNGYVCEDGARGVGICTTRAVVVSCISILASNYFVTSLFFSGT